MAIKEGVFNGEKTTIAVQIFGLPLGDCDAPKNETKELIEGLTLSIKQMQGEASLVLNNLNSIKNVPQVDISYYNQKIQEYNYLAKKVNDSVLALKGIIDLYNTEVSEYNECIKP